MAATVGIAGVLCCCAARGQSPGARPTAATNTSTNTAPPAKPPEAPPAGTLDPDKGGDVEKRLIDGAGGRAAGGAEKGAADNNKPADKQPLSLLSMLWPLLAVLGGMALLFWTARRYLPGMRRLTGSRVIEVLARTHLSPKQSIAVVKLGRRVLVVGQSADRLSALASITEPEEVSELVGLCAAAGPRSESSSFQRVFKRLDGEFSEAEDAAAGDEGEALGRVRSELDSLTAKVRKVARGKK
jgi:flagellar biogenesis protein FliO